ncbi:MAG: CPBP family intramembrane metalloprotease [Coriobacteriia bacterium]|nr:CPBP family intramembrane metalloprotease [Coriobacteriia bacterium]MCL2749812.1 CPBP family intramembrane metalloprotease [Coriobacteriia bacterium]
MAILTASIESPTDIQPHPSGEISPMRTPEEQLRRDIRVIVLVLMAMIIASSILVFLLTSVFMAQSPEFQSMIAQNASSGDSGGATPVAGAEANQLIADIAAQYMGVIMLIAALVTLPLVLVIRGKKVFAHDLTVVHQKARLSSILKVLVLMLGAGAAMGVIALALNPLFENFGLSLTEYYENSMAELLFSPIGILYVVLLGPIIEEIVFRGAILNRLAKHGFNFALVASALLFGLYHGILFQGISAFFMGLLLGYVALRYSIKWAMLLHVLNNSIAVGFTLLKNAGIGATYDILNWVFVGIFILAAVAILIWKRDQFSLMRQEGQPLTPRPFTIAFSSPMLILFAILFLGAGVLTTGLSGILESYSAEVIP